MGSLYTSGEWIVKAGREDEFVAAWRDLAEWSMSNVAGGGWAKLLRDRDDPRHFVSFGPWDSLEAIEEWRASPGFQERVGRIREMLEGFEPRTLEAAAEVERGG